MKIITTATISQTTIATIRSERVRTPIRQRRKFRGDHRRTITPEAGFGRRISHPPNDVSLESCAMLSHGRAEKANLGEAVG